MKHQPLWYVRRDGKLLGPHPRQVVVDCLLLGRFGWDDPASQDGRAWQPLKMHPEILAAIEPLSREARPVAGEPMPVSWHNERLAAARRWADERTGIDRRTGEEAGTVADLASADERRSLDERRRQRELLQVVLWRRLRRDLAGAYERTGASRWWWMPVAALAVAAIGIAIWQREPSTIEVSLASRAADCTAPAAPGVNWAGCERTNAALAGAQLRSARLAGARLAGADLRRADLSYADLAGTSLAGARLSEARLFGTTLTGADLSSAAMEGADLGFADLRNARIEGARFDRARLGNTLWIDGRRCAPTSVGRCD
jgi:hypothetical protein